MKRFAVVALILAALGPHPARAAVDVLTYHNDTLRTGWNAQETQLTPAVVGGSTFGAAFRRDLDDIAFAQPLVATAEKTAAGIRDLVIVGTENDTLYAFDAENGHTIWRRSLTSGAGGAVSSSFTGCPNQPSVGIASTPVIDRQLDTVYVVAATLEGAKANQHIHYRVHAIALGTGAERGTPVEIAATVAGRSGRIAFDPDVQAQRVGLAEANGRIYIAFGGSCDFNGNLYNGWIFSYGAATHRLLEVFNDTLKHDRNGNYMGGIWMSGEGLAVSPGGDIFFAAGNGTFDGASSLGDSAIKLAPGLGRPVLDYFTPDTVSSDNASDADFGSGGLMLLPDLTQPSGLPSLAVAQGKDGILTLMNQNDLGGYTPGGPDRVLAELSIGGVWSSPAYFQDSSGEEHLLTSGGPLYDVRVTRKPARLVVVAQTNEYYGMNNGNGATPSISSNGRVPGSAIVWTVYWNPNGDSLNLIAYAANNLTQQLFSSPLGNWHYTQTNNTMIPTIANGYVYVIGYRRLYAFSVQR